jgi:hypothetical protein
LVVLSVDPHVTVKVPKPDELALVVRLATPARKKGQVEQAIVRRFLELRADQKRQEAEEAETVNEDDPTIEPVGVG